MNIQTAVTASLITLSLMSCGGGSGGGTVATPPPTSTVPIEKTLISGVVSKGPLKAANVCAYAISGGLKSSLLGSCVTTDAAGNYSLDIGSFVGSVILEAIGGNYTDEATGKTVVLATPLHSLVSQVSSASGGARVAITALTELAYRQAATNTAGLSDSSIRSAFSKVGSRFGVADIAVTMPADALNVAGAATEVQKEYALALAVISQFQRDRSSLDLDAALTVLQSCIASPESGCGSGTGSAAIGAQLSGAMAIFKSDHPALAEVALPLATFSTVPNVASFSSAVASPIDVSWGIWSGHNWLQRLSPGLKAYQLCDKSGPGDSACSNPIGSEVWAYEGNAMHVSSGRALGINLAGLTFAQQLSQVTCIDKGLNAVYAAFLKKPKPQGGTGFDNTKLLGLAASNATSAEDFLKRYQASLVNAGVTAAADAVIADCPLVGGGVVGQSLTGTGLFIGMSGLIEDLPAIQPTVNGTSTTYIWRWLDSAGNPFVLSYLVDSAGKTKLISWAGNRTIATCILEGVNQFVKSCSSMGVTVNLTSGTVSFKDAPLTTVDDSGNIGTTTTGTVTGNLTFTPIGSMPTPTPTPTPTPITCKLPQVLKAGVCVTPVPVPVPVCVPPDVLQDGVCTLPPCNFTTADKQCLYYAQMAYIEHLNTKPIKDLKGNRVDASDTCTTWEVIGAPVELSACSYSSGASGFSLVRNLSSPAEICWTIVFNDGTESKGCTLRAPNGTNGGAGCLDCGSKKIGVRKFILTSYKTN